MATTSGERMSQTTTARLGRLVQFLGVTVLTSAIWELGVEDRLGERGLRLEKSLLAVRVVIFIISLIAAVYGSHVFALPF